VKERFGKAANVAVMIVERSKELLIRGQVPFGAPLQMASKQVWLASLHFQNLE
jgi:hypothetical protein